MFQLFPWGKKWLTGAAIFLLMNDLDLSQLQR